MRRARPAPLPPHATVLITLLAALLLAAPAEAAAGDKADGFFPDELADDGRDIVKVRGKGFDIALHGRLQTQAALWVGEDAAIEDADPAGEEGFRLRRARFGAEGRLANDFKLEVTLAMRNETAIDKAVENSVELLDGYVMYSRFGLAQPSLGVGKIAFSRTALTSSRYLQLIERPLSASGVGPGRHRGLSVWGGTPRLGALPAGLLAYGVGIYNGTPGFSRGNDAEGFLYAGRLVVAPLGPEGIHEYDGPRSKKPRLAFGVNAYRRDDARHDTDGLGADCTLRFQGLSVTGEWLWSRAEPKEEPALPPTLEAKVERRGWYAQGGYFVWKEYIELAGRYERFDENIFLDDEGDVQLVTGGVNWYVRASRLKVQVNYTRKDQLAGNELADDIVFAMVSTYF